MGEKCWLNSGKCIEPNYCKRPTHCAKNDTRAASAPQASQPPQGAVAKIIKWLREMPGGPLPYFENGAHRNDCRDAADVLETALAAPPQGAEAVEYLKGVYEFLESTAPAGLADEAFRLPPDASPALRLLLDTIQGDAHRERDATARQDQGARSEDRGPVAAAPPQGASSLLPELHDALRDLQAAATWKTPPSQQLVDRIVNGCRALSASPLPAPQEPVAWYVERVAPGFRDHGTRLGPFWKKEAAEAWVDDRHVLKPLYAAPAPVSPEIAQLGESGSVSAVGNGGAQA